jgi:hypothetical protein
MIELLLPTGNLSGCDCEQGSTRRPGWGPPPLAAWPAWGCIPPGGAVPVSLPCDFLRVRTASRATGRSPFH